MIQSARSIGVRSPILLTHLGSQSTPDIPALISYAPLSIMRIGGVVIIVNGRDHSIGLSDVCKLCAKSCKQPPSRGRPSSHHHYYLLLLNDQSLYRAVMAETSNNK